MVSFIFMKTSGREFKIYHAAFPQSFAHAITP
jgi:hypothetical protein